jgi:hypothetical protein
MSKKIKVKKKKKKKKKKINPDRAKGSGPASPSQNGCAHGNLLKYTLNNNIY